jgi:hypothetical protein
MSAVMTANIVLVVVNLVLMTTLLVLYGRLVREVRTLLTYGLLAFAGVLWLQNAVQLYFFATMMTYYAGGVEGLVLVQNGLATVAGVFLTLVNLFPDGLRRGQKAPTRR